MFQDIFDCEKSVPKGFVSPNKQEPLCYVMSKDDSTFTFPSLPVGKYSIVSIYNYIYNSDQPICVRKGISTDWCNIFITIQIIDHL